MQYAGLIQRPARWFFSALGVLSGLIPSQLIADVQPTLDVIQAGWGVAIFEQQVVNGSTVTGTVTTFDVPLTESWRIRLSMTNPGTANALLTVRLGISPLNIMTWFVGNVGAATTSSWAVLAQGQDYIDVPPGFRVEITQGQYTTNPGSLSLVIAKLPAGASLS